MTWLIYDSVVLLDILKANKSFRHIFLCVFETPENSLQRSVTNSKAVPVAEWVRTLIFRALIHLSSQCYGFEHSLGHM